MDNILLMHDIMAILLIQQQFTIFYNVNLFREKMMKSV